MYRTTRLIAVCAVFATGLILIPTGAAGAEPAGSASPATDLVDGQTVTVDYSGFPAGATIAVVQCTAAPPANDTECDGQRFELGSADPDGAGTVEFTVHTGTIGADGTTCDGAENNDCAIMVTDFPLTVSAVLPITFAANAGGEDDTTTSTTEPETTTTNAGDGDADAGTDADATSDDDSDDDGSNVVVPVVIGVLAVAVAVAGAVLFARRRS